MEEEWGSAQVTREMCRALEAWRELNETWQKTMKRFRTAYPEVTASDKAIRSVFYRWSPSRKHQCRKLTDEMKERIREWRFQGVRVSDLPALFHQTFPASRVASDTVRREVYRLSTNGEKSRQRRDHIEAGKWRSFIHISDLVDAICSGKSEFGEVNVSDPDQIIRVAYAVGAAVQSGVEQRLNAIAWGEVQHRENDQHVAS